MDEKKRIYESPEAVIIEFELADHLASSADYGPGALCGEMEM